MVSRNPRKMPDADRARELGLAIAQDLLWELNRLRYQDLYRAPYSVA